MGSSDHVGGVVVQRQCVRDVDLFRRKIAGYVSGSADVGAGALEKLAEEIADGDRSRARALLRMWGIW